MQSKYALHLEPVLVVLLFFQFIYIVKDVLCYVKNFCGALAMSQKVSVLPLTQYLESKVADTKNLW